MTEMNEMNGMVGMNGMSAKVAGHTTKEVSPIHPRTGSVLSSEAGTVAAP